LNLPIGRPCWEKPAEFVLRDAFTSSGSWISLLTGTASNETIVHQRPAGTGQSVKVGVCGARWSWVALWPFFRLRLWPVCLQSVFLCVFDIKLASPVRVHLLLNYIDFLTFALFERMEVFIVSARHQASCYSKALAGQLIPVLACLARVCNIVEQWTDSEPVLFVPSLAHTYRLGQLNIHRRGPLGIEVFIKFGNSDAGATTALNWIQHGSCSARVRAIVTRQARTSELVPVLVLSALMWCLFFVADAPVIRPVLGTLDTVLN